MSEVLLKLPAPVAAFAQALNAGEERALLATFAEGVLINDEGQEHCGEPRISAWVKRVLEQRLRIEPCAATVNGDLVKLTATADGAFDKRGLPDPLLLVFYFSVRGNAIAQLIILRTEPDALAD